MFLKKLFNLKSKASDELEEAVAAELDKPDPDPKQARAILNGCTDDKDNTKSS